MIISRHAKRVDNSGKLYLITRTRSSSICPIAGNRHLVDETVVSHNGEIIEFDRMSPELRKAAIEFHKLREDYQ